MDDVKIKVIDSDKLINAINEGSAEDTTQDHTCTILMIRSIAAGADQKWKVKIMDEMTLTLNSPITEEQWDAVTDVDFEHTNRIWFHTKHGKEIEFVKRKKGKWIYPYESTSMIVECSECSSRSGTTGYSLLKFCPNCGADMRGEQDE